MKFRGNWYLQMISSVLKLYGIEHVQATHRGMIISYARFLPMIIGMAIKN